jgi:hypothetical protein
LGRISFNRTYPKLGRATSGFRNLLSRIAA